tara:strand:+ start:1065 stop:1463 length:399 start_codon:yes stop_codon:yes gene_type:complete
MEEEIQASETVDSLREVVNEVSHALGYKDTQTDEAYAALHYTISTIIGSSDAHSHILGWETALLVNPMLPETFIDYSRDILLPKVQEWRKSGVDIEEKLGVYMQVLTGGGGERGLMNMNPEERKMFIDVINL